MKTTNHHPKKEVLLSTLKRTVEEFHPAVGNHKTAYHSEYSRVRVEWRNGRVTYHLDRSDFITCGGITVQDPWSGCQWGVSDSLKKAKELGLEWPSEGSL